MSFYSDLRNSILQIAVALGWISVSVVRYIRHHSYGTLELVMLCFWLLILMIWTLHASTHWRFNTTALEQVRAAAFIRSVPYSDIVSVDPISSNKSATQFVILYGPNAFSQPSQRMVINPGKRADFLEMLEQRAPQATFNV